MPRGGTGHPGAEAGRSKTPRGPGPTMPIEEQGERNRPTGDGKGLNYKSFSDSGHYADVMRPHAPHVNPAGTYGNPEGAGVDNTRGIAKVPKTKSGHRRKD